MMAVVLILFLCWSPLVVGDGSSVDTVSLLVMLLLLAQFTAVIRLRCSRSSYHHPTDS